MEYFSVIEALQRLWRNPRTAKALRYASTQIAARAAAALAAQAARVAADSAQQAAVNAAAAVLAAAEEDGAAPQLLMEQAATAKAVSEVAARSALSAEELSGVSSDVYDSPLFKSRVGQFA